MFTKSEDVIIDDLFIEQMIERCYSINQYLKVDNSGVFYAELNYGKYTYRNIYGTFTKSKTLITLKTIFKALIIKYQSFEHEGYHYSFGRGKWSKYKI